MSRTKELFNNTLLFTISQFSSKLLVFIMIPFYTAYLSTDDYGTSNLITTSVSLLYPILTLCISEAVLRFVIEDKNKASFLLWEGFKTSTIGGIIVCVLSPIVAIALNLDWSLLPFFPLIFYTHAIQLLLAKFSRGIDRVKDSAVAGVIQTFATVLTNIVLIAVFKLGVIGYLSSFIVGNLSYILYVYIKSNISSYLKFYRDFSFPTEYYKYSIPLVPNNLSWWLVDSASTYIINGFLGVAAVGIYSAASRIPTIVTVFSGIFMEAWLLSVLKEYNTSGGKEYIKKMYNLYTTAMLLVSVIIILLSHLISRILLKGDFIEGWVYIPLLICSTFYGGLSAFLGTIYSAEKKTQLYFTSTLLGGIVTVALSLALVKSLDLYAIPIGVMIGYVSIWIMRLITTRKYIKVETGLLEAIKHVLLIVVAILTMKELYLYAVVCALIQITLCRDSVIAVFKILKNSNIYGKISNKG